MHRSCGRKVGQLDPISHNHRLLPAPLEVNFRLQIVQNHSARIAHAMADVLRERATSLELTQRDVAHRTGLSQPRISRVFAHGVALTFEVTLRLCGALELTLEEAYAEAVRRVST